MAEAQRIQRLIDSPQPAGRGRRLATSALALIAAPAVAKMVADGVEQRLTSLWPMT
jgi:hypothetical protein